ncbi:12337_t:CDS:10 [Cetraspora pellucida]|uniref:12337_t:CDS:1 n=1 Tax=Cetraspora pellucida TaxID=1433469 RepID=A0A9N9GHW1_9GLOM|nr:12337_t:CDS:10 [Cetraspora pellucida]
MSVITQTLNAKFIVTEYILTAEYLELYAMYLAYLSTKSKPKIFREHKNQLEREWYARCMTQTNEISAGSSESFYECKNCLAREFHAHCLENETFEEAEQKKQNEAKQQITNAARIKNYDTNAVKKVVGTKQSSIFSTCCAKGKVQLPVISTPPILLHKLLTEESAQACDFRKKIQLQYTTPTGSEVAVLIVGDGQDIEPSNRDIVLQKQGSGFQRISEIYQSYSPLHYVLLFLHGNSGWHPESTSEDECTNDNTIRGHVSMMQCYVYHLQLQIHEPSKIFVLHRARHLFQQYIVDAYAYIKQSRLNYLRHNQKTICAELYSGLQDTLTTTNELPTISSNSNIDTSTVEVIDEIWQYIDAYYVSVSESFWRIIHYKMHNEAPDIMHLVVHLPGQHMITFSDNDSLKAIVQHVQNKKTTLTAWFEANRDPMLAPLVSKYTYAQFPQAFVFNKNTKKWKPRLLQDDLEWDRCLEEAAKIRSGHQLRHLFAIILINCQPNEPDFTEDVIYHSQNHNLQLTEHEIENDALNKLEIILLQQNKTLKDFPNMPLPDSVHEFRNELINEELNYNIQTLTEFVELNTNHLNKDQLKLIDFIYPVLQIYTHDPTYIVERSILVPCNSEVNMLNTEILLQFPGEAKTYYSANVLDQTLAIYNPAHEDMYSTKYLNSLMLSGLPPYALTLKVGSPIILLCNIDRNEGFCNGTQLICRTLQSNVIEAKHVSGSFKGKKVFLPCVELSPTNSSLLFAFKQH